MFVYANAPPQEEPLPAVQPKQCEPVRMEMSAKVSGSMSQTALHIGTMQLASSKGSHCADPGLREWQGDDGVIYDFNWSS